MKNLLKIVFLLINMQIHDALHAKDNANYASTNSLCYKHESEYFSCKIKASKKIASVCAAGNSSPDHGYVQYRFGTHETVEYKFPRSYKPPRGRITIVDVSKFPDGLGSHIKFESNGYHYVISNALVPGEIYVTKNGKTIFDGICEGNLYIPFDNAARHGIEYGKEDSSDKLIN